MIELLQVERLRQALLHEYTNHTAPDNDGSGYLSFGELLALNEASRAFNDEMKRSGNLEKAQAVSEQVEDKVFALAKDIERNGASR